jgi:hypothetical protein
MKQRIPIAISFITGIFIIVAFYFPNGPVGDIEQRTLVWFAVVIGISMVVGVESLLRVNLQKVAQLKKGWGYSLVLLICCILTLVTATMGQIKYGSPFHVDSPFMYVFTYMVVPLQATMFAILSFFIASAAYRAFRARNLAATLLLFSAVLVMLGRVPIGEKIWTEFPRISDWIMNVPQIGAKRGIMIGAYLGAAATSIRIILGIERSYIS